MNKISNKFLIAMLFVLGVVLIPSYKADALSPTVTVSANPTTIPYGGTTTITWSSSVVNPQPTYEPTPFISCTRSDKPGVSIGSSGSFTTDKLYSNYNVTIACSTQAFCSGRYQGKIGYPYTTPYDNRSTNWSVGVMYGSTCSSCSDAQGGNKGYEVVNNTWYSHLCSEDKFLGACTGEHWSVAATNLGSAYASTTCGKFTNQATCQPVSGCTWYN